MSERDQSLSRAVQELSAKVATWEAELAAWPPAVGESVGRALETAAERAEERSRRETATWRAAMQTEVTRLTKLIAQQGQQHAALGGLIERQEQVLVPWWLRLIREKWRAGILALAVGLVVGGGGMLLYQTFGPAAQELRRYRGMWEAMTTEEKARVNKRSGGRPPSSSGRGGPGAGGRAAAGGERSQERARQLIAAGQERRRRRSAAKSAPGS